VLERDPKAPYGVLAAIQILGGVLIIAYGILEAPPVEKPADFIAGPVAIVLGILSATVVRSLGKWAIVTSLVASAVLMGFLSTRAESGQAQIAAGYGFVLVAALAGSLLPPRSLSAFLVLLVGMLCVSYLINPAITNPLYLLVIGAVVVMVSSAVAVVIARSRAVSEQYRRTAERLDAVWNSQLDPFLLLEPIASSDGNIADFLVLQANQAAREGLGLAEALEARSIRETVPDQFYDELVSRFAHCLQTGDPVILRRHAFTLDPQGLPRLFDIRGFRVDQAIAVTWQDVTERTILERDLEQRARYDSLTGCLSRSEGLLRLEQMLSTRRSGETPPLILFCDLDNFKDVNDGYGHATGDAVLREVATRISRIVRSDDPLIRAGGDEFIVALGGIRSFDVGLSIAEKVRLAVADPIDTPAGPVSVTISIGVASGRAGQSVDEILSLADQAMYQAKQQGRDRVVAVTDADAAVI